MPALIETRLKFGGESERLVADWYKSKNWNITWPEISDSWDLRIHNDTASSRIKVTRDLSMASTDNHSLLFERAGQPSGIMSKDFDMWCVVDINSIAYFFEINKLRAYIKRVHPGKIFQMHQGIAYSISFQKIITDLKPMTVSLKPQKQSRYEF